MLIVQTSIVSDDIADCRFSCNLGCCHGACCVEGDSGAPLLEEEVPRLEELRPQILPLLTPQGRAAVEAQGMAVRDAEGSLGTPLIDGGACAYMQPSPDGTTLCAIQHLYKPISCHLYPIRVDDYGEFTAVNYHRWDICRPATDHGTFLYQYLREPLIRRFGQAWYDELLQAIADRQNNQH